LALSFSSLSSAGLPMPRLLVTRDLMAVEVQLQREFTRAGKL
jgi:hypothetical protein